MPATYEPIATTTLGSAASTITFSSIPATYTDLRLVIIGTTSANADPELTFNSDTGTNYSRTTLGGNGTAADSVRDTSIPYIVNRLVFFTSSTPSWQAFDIFSYAGATNKTVLCEGVSDANGSGGVGRAVGLWRSTAAINTVRLAVSGKTFSSGTTATLYGILKA